MAEKNATSNLGEALVRRFGVGGLPYAGDVYGFESDGIACHSAGYIFIMA